MVTRRQIRRATQPSLLNTAARTAVITKTATTVAGNSAAKQQAAMAQQSAAAQPAAASPPAETPAQPEATHADRFAALRELGELKAAGILTEEEFESEKARILNG